MKTFSQDMSEQVPPCVLEYALNKMEWLKLKLTPNHFILYWVASIALSIPFILMGFMECRNHEGEQP